MQPFSIVTGVAAALPAANVDTDVIMPKQFLKGVDRSGLDRGVFHDQRFDNAGAVRPDFVLNRDPWCNAKFLVVGPNFGCGSSREHAVWGLGQLGIRVLIGTSFAGIFFDNCARNGVLGITLDEASTRRISELATDPATCQLTVDLPGQRVLLADGSVVSFEIEPGRKQALVLGLDAVGATLQDRAAITSFEHSYLVENPWLA
ncbi:MAG: 3-isopropylmalate dehydratase small subunit [Tardiphaga sp.]|jgi:3-isopropylmalate/(R)-2-methylmalate dehydratase small subunit|uniref:3-isopropylmalate dehydratase small subunit n=1 Tax=Tardiphaga sp. TaxID=1926292 RepID=UPI00262F184E|nr:3-isopropylmalate dehydratase small subunit [Tardiphaga sp.]MDB5502888.1 3-isopropylmalate dehydratase small subunit [Tardiphaga sp.]